MTPSQSLSTPSQSSNIPARTKMSASSQSPLIVLKRPAFGHASSGVDPTPSPSASRKPLTVTPSSIIPSQSSSRVLQSSGAPGATSGNASLQSSPSLVISSSTM